MASVAGWAKQSILYEFLSLEGRNHFIREHEDGNANRAWTDKVIEALTHAPGSATLATRAGDPAHLSQDFAQEESSPKPRKPPSYVRSIRHLVTALGRARGRTSQCTNRTDLRRSI